MCTETKLKIQLFGEVKWVPEQHAWKANIELRLPAKDYALVEELRNREVRILDMRLTVSWGNSREEGYRYMTEARYFDSKCEAEEWIKECFTEIIDELKEVVEKNRKYLTESKEIILETEI